MKVLVTYYSRTGNNRMTAEAIAKDIKADVFEIKEEKNRKGIIGWILAGRDAMRGKEAKLVSKVPDLSAYNCILVCTPVWSRNAIPPVRRFLSEADISGKRVGVISTCGGNPGKSEDTYKEIVKKKNGKWAGFSMIVGEKDKKEMVEKAVNAAMNLMR